MGYDLRHYTQTFRDSNKANGSSDAILNKYPFVCSREALMAALNSSGVVSVGQRNASNLSLTEMTDKIIEAWDNIMFYDWDNTTNTINGAGYGYVLPESLQGGIVNGQNWADPGFWSFSGRYFIAFKGSGTPSSGALTAENISAQHEVILLPSTTYEVNIPIYKLRPFLGLDVNGYIKNDSSGAYTLVGADDFGLSLTMTGSATASGTVASVGNPTSTTHDDVSSVTSGNTLLPQLLTIYDFNTFHDDLNPNGTDFSYGTKYSGADNIETSTQWFDLRAAKFTVTISGGKVTAITPAGRNDGSAVSRTGGWQYTSSDDYTELLFIGAEDGTLASTKLAPRVLYRTSTDSDVSGEGKKATVDITAADSEFYAGSGLVQSDITTAFAIAASSDAIDRGISFIPSATITSTADSDFTSRVWPNATTTNGIDPSVVRITHERPILTTRSRSLKSTTVGTGAHRLSFEFEYPAMETATGEAFIRAFEEYKGASQSIQIYIPNQAIDFWEGYVTDNISTTVNANMWVYKQFISVGALGSNSITVDGHVPGAGGVPAGNYFYTAKNDKIHKVLGNSGNADNYGRITYFIEPPLLQSQANSNIVSNSRYLNGPNDGGELDATRGKYFLAKVFLVDDTLDYTIDAAGFYRMQFKFREAI